MQTAQTAWLRLLDGTSALILESRFSRFVVGVIAFSLLRNGFWLIPNFGTHRLIASNPFVNPFPDKPFAHYLLYSPLTYLVTKAVHAYATPLGFIVFHLALLLLGVVGMLLVTRYCFGDRAARWVGLAFAILPVSANLQIWMGNVDIFTFLLTTALVLSGRPLVNGLLAMLVGFNHFDQGLLAIGGLSALQAILRLRTRTALIIQMAGLVFGRLLVAVWFYLSNIEVNGGRLYWVQQIWPRLIVNGLLNIQVFLFSVFGALWPAVLLIVFWLWQQNRRAAYVAIGAFLLFIPPAIIAHDNTRIYAMISWPLVMALILWLQTGCPEVDREMKDRLLAVCVLVALIVPPFVVWRGIHSSALVFDIVAAFDWMLGTHFVWQGDTPTIFAPFNRR